MSHLHTIGGAAAVIAAPIAVGTPLYFGTRSLRQSGQPDRDIAPFAVGMGLVGGLFSATMGALVPTTVLPRSPLLPIVQRSTPLTVAIVGAMALAPTGGALAGWLRTSPDVIDSPTANAISKVGRSNTIDARTARLARLLDSKGIARQYIAPTIGYAFASGRTDSEIDLLVNTIGDHPDVLAQAFVSKRPADAIARFVEKNKENDLVLFHQQIGAFLIGSRPTKAVDLPVIRRASDAALGDD
jgi:hypothetical protein